MKHKLGLHLNCIIIFVLLAVGFWFFFNELNRTSLTAMTINKTGIEFIIAMVKTFSITKILFILSSILIGAAGIGRFIEVLNDYRKESK